MQAGGNDPIRPFTHDVTQPLRGLLLWDPGPRCDAERKEPFFFLFSPPPSTLQPARQLGSPSPCVPSCPGELPVAVLWPQTASLLPQWTLLTCFWAFLLLKCLGVSCQEGVGRMRLGRGREVPVIQLPAPHLEKHHCLCGFLGSRFGGSLYVR